MNPLKIFTSPTSLGVFVRDLTVIVGSVVTVLGVLGLLDAEQQAALTEQAPELMTAIGSVATIAMSIYRILTKSSSEKAAKAAKEIDAGQAIVVETRGTKPNRIITGPGDV